MRSTSRRTVIAAALLTSIALLGAACSSSKTSTTTGTTAGGSASTFDYSGLSGTLNGSGSTFQKQFDEAAIAGFADVAPNVTVNYGGGGSGKGKTDLASQVVQWAGTDSLIKEADLPTFKGGTVLYFPTVAAPVTVSYNLSGVDKLQLSPATVAKIFSTTVTTWNDPAIAADNPGVTLPSTPITVAHRSDGSGTTSAFTNYLKKAGGSDWTLGAGDTVNWAASTQAGNGNQGVAQIIKSTAGAVGYVDFADAKASGLVFASIKNKAGDYVAPSLEGTSAAMATGTVNANLTLDVLDAPGPGVYPISAPTYVIAYQKQPDAKVGNALKGWLNYLLTDAQDLAADANFAKLPTSLQQQALTQLNTLQIG